MLLLTDKEEAPLTYRLFAARFPRVQFLITLGDSAEDMMATFMQVGT